MHCFALGNSIYSNSKILLSSPQKTNINNNMCWYYSPWRVRRGGVCWANLNNNGKSKNYNNTPRFPTQRTLKFHSKYKDLLRILWVSTQEKNTYQVFHFRFPYTFYHLSWGPGTPHAKNNVVIWLAWPGVSIYSL